MVITVPASPDAGLTLRSTARFCEGAAPPFDNQLARPAVYPPGCIAWTRKQPERYPLTSWLTWKRSGPSSSWSAGQSTEAGAAGRSVRAIAGLGWSAAL